MNTPRQNPFKFGSIVKSRHFTYRTRELERVRDALNSPNHLIVTGPRRYGKSSLVLKAINELHRPCIAVDMQLITSPRDLAEQLLKRTYRIFPFEKMKQLVKTFRIVPSISLSPLSNEVEISFRPDQPSLPILEDVLSLIEKLGSDQNRIIVVLDEFQEAHRIDKELPRHLRSHMQHHRHVNYIFLGSQESMIRNIFENIRSPFYHFGMVLPVGRIPRSDFTAYLENGFSGTDSRMIVDDILNITQCHPYHTQQLAYAVWEIRTKYPGDPDLVKRSVDQLITDHDIDYERLWNTFNRTDKKILIGLALSSALPLSNVFKTEFDLNATSTIQSALKRLTESGHLTKLNGKVEIDDPFFKRWIAFRRGK